MKEEIKINDIEINNDDNLENLEQQIDDVVFIVTDEEGIDHKLRMLTIFTAGAMKRQYVAGMTCDILLFAYKTVLTGNEYKAIVSEIINDVEYSQVLNIWETYVEEGLKESDIHEETVYISMLTDEGSVAEIPITGMVYKRFVTSSETSDEQCYVAICPQNIMFYRYDENETEGNESIVISQIYSPQEYEDVAAEFHKMIEEDNKEE